MNVPKLLTPELSPVKFEIGSPTISIDWLTVWREMFKHDRVKRRSVTFFYKVYDLSLGQFSNNAKNPNLSLYSW
jgi:hypothetical protein